MSSRWCCWLPSRWVFWSRHNHCSHIGQDALKSLIPQRSVSTANKTVCGEISYQRQCRTFFFILSEGMDCCWCLMSCVFFSFQSFVWYHFTLDHEILSPFAKTHQKKWTIRKHVRIQGYDVNNASTICAHLSDDDIDGINNLVERDIASTKIYLQVRVLFYYLIVGKQFLINDVDN